MVAEGIGGGEKEKLHSAMILGDSLSRGVVFSEEKNRCIFSDNSFFGTVRR